jgi:methylmalonyl-CoA mutase
LAFVLASLTEVLRRHDASGQTMETAIAATEIALSVDQEQFLSIAKCRAMRRLHARLQEACGMEVLQPARLHAETSYRMLTVLDPETNILRNTIAVFAAGVGGADSISVLPHTLALGLPDRFARRVARNTQTVLVDECHLAFVQDPAAGSGAIEQLTDALCDRAWQEFRQIEREGGLKASLSTGAVQARIAKAYSALLDEVRSGKRPLVGTTIYSAQAERRFEVLDKRKPGLDPSPSHLAPIALHSAAAQGAAA